MSTDLVELRLFVAGTSPNSRQAVANLTALCAEYLPERHRLEIVDVLLHPERALQEGILLTPTLVVLSVHPARTVVGSLSRPEVVLEAVGLP